MRDEENFDFWNIGSYPSCKDIDDYCCEHGLEFTTVSSKRNNIFASHSIAVLENESAVAWKLVLKNETGKQKKIGVFPFLEFHLGEGDIPKRNWQRNAGETEFIKEANTILCTEHRPNEHIDFFSGYLMSSEDVTSFEGRLEKFFGTVGNYALPLEIRENNQLSCSNSVARRRSGVLKNDVTLEIGEEKTIYYILGFSPSDKNYIINNYKVLINKAKKCI